MLRAPAQEAQREGEKVKSTFNKKCSHDGCSEFGHWGATSRQERLRLSERYKDWKCLRHKNPDEVLRAENYTKETSRELTVLMGGKYEFKHFDNSSSGFLHGHKWRAWIDDFPVGTKIIETTTIQVILPETPTAK